MECRCIHVRVITSLISDIGMAFLYRRHRQSQRQKPKAFLVFYPNKIIGEHTLFGNTIAQVRLCSLDRLDRLVRN